MFDGIDNDPSVDKISVLQRQSWQLELIITGFALAGMISGADTFHDFIVKWRSILSNYGTLGREPEGADYRFRNHTIQFFYAQE